MNTLFILCGIPFSGKSTVAKRLAALKGYIRIDLDEVKQAVFEPEVKDSSIDQEGWNRIYKEMYKRINDELQSGKTVINDTGNFTLQERNYVRAIADRLGIPCIAVYIETPISIARKRMVENRLSKVRFDVSDADFESTVSEMEPPLAAENHLIYDGTTSMDEWIKEYIR